MENQVFDANSTIGARSTIGAWSKIGARSTIGAWSTIGDESKIGARSTIGDGSTIGDCAELGKKITAEGVKVFAFFSMSNLDGTGRKINIFIHSGGVLVRAGCFKGSLDEFCKKADSEGKTRYAKVVRAAAEALLEHANETGETGGWGEQE